MRAAPWTLALALGLQTLPALADIPLEIIDRGASRITLDGLLRDWTAFTSLTAVDDASRVVRGASAWRGPDDASFGYALARDDDSLWLAAEVRDDTIVRSREHREGEDTLMLSLAVQTGGRTVGYDIAILPGEPGSYAGVVRFAEGRNGNVPGASVVEAPLPGGGGFTIEVRIPWSAIPELRANRSTLRGRIAYFDTDSPAHPVTDTVIATGAGDGRHPMELPAAVGAVGDAGPGALLDRFRIEHDLGTANPLLDRAADLAGDGQMERVVLFPRYLLAFGAGIAGGSGYVFVELPSRAAADVLESSVRDVTGDGHAEVVLRLRAPGEGFDRELLYVYGINTAGTLQRYLAHEVGRSTGVATRLTDRVSWEPGGRLRVTLGSNQGFARASWPNVREEGVEAPITPWGTDRARVYRWDAPSHTFVLEHAEANPDAETVGTVTTVSTGTTTVATPEPEVPLGPDVEGVLSLFREREHVAPDARPSFRARGNVAEDPIPETLLVYGHTLVVVGPSFMGGRSYYTMSLPADGPDDVLGLSLADFTGDGRSEAVVRVRRRLQARVLGQTVPVEKELLLVYMIDGPHRGRIFGAEVARRSESNSITNTVVLPRNGGALTLQAGSSRGWSIETYPFHDNPTPGIESLLLPWVSPRQRSYRWNGTAVIPQE